MKTTQSETTGPKHSSKIDKSARKVIVGVIGEDCHCIALRLLDFVLQRDGLQTINLGIMVSQEEFVDAARETAADAVAISSSNGLALVECQGIKEKFVEAGLSKIPLYIGGNLSMEEEASDKVEETFSNLGFNRVYHKAPNFNQFLADLKQDLRA
jgi:methylaspartate mutase sigma subunit